MPEKSMKAIRKHVGESRVTVEDLRIERGKVSEFARAVRDDNPAYRDESAASEQGFEAIPAPPTFTRTAYFERNRPAGVDEDFGFDLGLKKDRILHGEQAYEYERVPTVGDVLRGTTTLVDAYQREGGRGGTMTFLVYETEYRNQDDELVLTERMTRIETGSTVEEDG